LRHGSYPNNLFVQIPGIGLGDLDRPIVLNPTEQDVNEKADKRSPADPTGLFLPKKTGYQRENDDSRENQVDDKEEIPGVPTVKKG
jgi:hypothetical protein